jgi:O-antigen/teichoic acid export membrane protein
MSEIAKKSLETFVFRSFAQAASLAVGIAVARLFGPYGKGMYAYVTTALGLLVTLASGQSSAIAWQLAKKKQPPRAVYAAMLRTIALFAVPLASIIVVLAALQPAHRLLLAVAAALPFVLYLALANGFFLSYGDVRSGNMQTFLSALVLLVATPLALLARGGLVAVLIVWVCSFAGAAVYSTFRIRRYLRPSQPETAPYPFAEQFFFGLKATLNALVEELNLRIDVFIVLSILGARALGIYSLGVGIAGLLWQLSRPIATAAFGRIGASNEINAAELTARCMRHSFIVVTIAAAVAFVVGPSVITLVYGARFAPAGSVLRLLLPGIIAYCIMPLLATFFAQQLGRPSIPLALSTASTLICAAVTAALIPRYGIAAGAVATSMSYVAAVSTGTWVFVRRTGISPLRLLILDRYDLHRYRHLLSAVAGRAGKLVAP